jgi:hypothetical protein
MILLLHDGELRDIRSLLDEIGVPVRERVGPLRPAESNTPWKTVIATPKRLLAFKPLPSGPRPMMIGIGDGCSNTLRTQMQRLRVDYVVDRPVHPVALRLLLLHALYNGPERRRLGRVSIGAPARIKTGLFAKPVTLAEISIRGARILAEHPLAPGARLKLVIGRELTKTGSLKLSSSVVRASDAGEAGVEVGLRFEDMNAKLTQALKRFVDLHQRGPVQIRHHVSDRGPASSPASTPGPSLSQHADPFRDGTNAGPTASSDGQAADPGGSERRTEGRHPYASRVVALDSEAARVFIGRDISTGGMRVDSHPDLGLGARLKLALHAGPRSEPVLVDALVDRDDGDEGIFLRFSSVDDRMQRELDLVIGRLAFSTGDPGDGGVVVSELIGFEPAP